MTHEIAREIEKDCWGEDAHEAGASAVDADVSGYAVEGAEAFSAGIDRSQCPYEERSLEWGAWMYGWNDAYTDVALS
jgi:hypothetical protein